MMYGMRRTTVYLPDGLKRDMARASARAGLSEAEFIRQAVARAVNAGAPPAPKLPLFRSGAPTLAERVDEALAGFGER
jgi:hypothetical protein